MQTSAHPIYFPTQFSTPHSAVLHAHGGPDEIDSLASLVTLAGEATSANTFERRNVHMSAHFIAQQGLTITLQI
jgi:hypothetical protein